MEAPDEAAHTGDLENKIRAIEDFDSKVVKTVLEGITEFDEYKVLVLPDHRTPIVKKTHTAEPVPFAFCSSKNIQEAAQKAREFNEVTAENSDLFLAEGFHLMDVFITS